MTYRGPWSLWPALAAVAVAWLVFGLAVDRLSGFRLPTPRSDLLVNLPRGIQVALSGGDRYLAANIATARALVASTEVDEVGLGVQSAIQTDVAHLNPGHEDNYYLAAASLVGSDFHVQGQEVLFRAIGARPFDFIPPFFYGVHRMHYDRDPLGGAKWVQVAAERSAEEATRIALEKTAVRWIQRGQDPAMAASVLEAMAKQARHSTLRHYIEQRASQARVLVSLEEAVARYVGLAGRQPRKLEDLLMPGVLEAIPDDPLGNGFALDAQGKPVALKQKRANR